MKINSLNCVSAFENVGVGRCSFIPREIVGAILVPASFVITEANANDLQAFLQAAAQDPVTSARILPIHNFVGITDSSEEPVRQTLGYGSVRTIRDGNYGWTLQFVDGGLCLLSSLQAHNGQKTHVIFIDAGGTLIGTKKVNGLGGIPVDDFWANKWTAPDGTNTAILSLFFSFKPVYINERLSFIQAGEDLDFEAVVGLQDVVITALSAAAATATVALADKCSGDNTFSDLFGADIAAGTGFEAVGVDGTVQAITTVAYNATTRVYTLTFSAPRTVATVLSLVDLSTLDIEGYEGTELNLPVTLP